MGLQEYLLWNSFSIWNVLKAKNSHMNTNICQADWLDQFYTVVSIYLGIFFEEVKQEM